MPTVGVTTPPTLRPASALDLTGYHLTFDDEFNALSISHSGARTRWTSRLWDAPRGGQIGVAHFSDIESNGYQPFSVANGVLSITATSGQFGRQSGVMMSIDQAGKGFSQQYGYFEVRAKLPLAHGTNSQFWMLPLSIVRTRIVANAEIDIVEADGDTPRNILTTVHSYARGYHVQNSNQFSKLSFDETTAYHTYGVLWDEKHISWYVDRELLIQWPTPADCKQPFFLVADLALGNNPATPPDASTPKKVNLLIDYIRAYSSDPSVPAVKQEPVSSPDGVIVSP